MSRINSYTTRLDAVTDALLHQFKLWGIYCNLFIFANWLYFFYYHHYLSQWGGRSEFAKFRSRKSGNYFSKLVGTAYATTTIDTYIYIYNFEAGILKYGVPQCSIHGPLFFLFMEMIFSYHYPTPICMFALVLSTNMRLLKNLKMF